MLTKMLAVIALSVPVLAQATGLTLVKFEVRPKTKSFALQDAAKRYLIRFQPGQNSIKASEFSGELLPTRAVFSTRLADGAYTVRFGEYETSSQAPVVIEFDVRGGTGRIARWDARPAGAMVDIQFTASHD